MPEIATKYFGSLEYKEAEVIEFPSGIPAFEREAQFLLIEPPASGPLVFLQSVRTPGLCFLALPMGGIDREYRLTMVLEDLRSLGLAEDRQPAIGPEVRCFAIVAMMEDGSLTANLLAPIVVNSANRRGVQAIRLDSDYSHRYPVAEGLCW